MDIENIQSLNSQVILWTVVEKFQYIFVLLLEIHKIYSTVTQLLNCCTAYDTVRKSCSHGITLIVIYMTLYSFPASRNMIQKPPPSQTNYSSRLCVNDWKGCNKQTLYRVKCAITLVPRLSLWEEEDE